MSPEPKIVLKFTTSLDNTLLTKWFFSYILLRRRGFQCSVKALERKSLENGDGDTTQGSDRPSSNRRTVFLFPNLKISLFF